MLGLLLFQTVGKERHLAGAFDLAGQLALVFGAQARGAAWQNLAELVYQSLQFFRLSVTQRDLVLTQFALVTAF